MVSHSAEDLVITLTLGIVCVRAHVRVCSCICCITERQNAHSASDGGGTFGLVLTTSKDRVRVRRASKVEVRVKGLCGMLG